MPPKIQKYLFPFLLILISFIVCALNYTPHTILSGWDTLHPEFNYLLNLKRVFFGVFRPEQGLGAVAAHSHMSEIPRIFLLMLMNILLPTNFVRYAYIFLTLIIGPLGVFYFLKHLFHRENGHKLAQPAAFLGGLFYMLNLGTLQQFTVPFEMFNTLYAFLPWIFLYAIKYLQSDKIEHKKYLLIFSFFTFLGAPMAYAPALWYMHFGMLILFLGIISIAGITKRDFSAFKKSIVLLIFTLFVNSFWLLPHIYFLLTHSSDVQTALVNKLFSDQAFLYNKEFGNIFDLALLKSFLFTWNVYNGHGSFGYLLNPWIEYLKHTPVLVTGYFLSVIALIGFIYALVKRNIYLVALIGVSLFTLFFLFNDNPPFGFLFSLIQNKIPLFKEAFRFPDTKLFIHYIFLFSVFFGTGVFWLMNLWDKKIGKISPKIIPAIFAILIVGFMLPAFRGNYVNPQMRIKIPSNYTQMSSYLNTQSDMGKVALLPINSFWGWDYYSWGYQGSGFTWFDIKQPVLARDFDRWSPYNEEYYREMAYAVYSQDPVKLENVIKKYGISYLVFDKSIIAPENDPKVLFTTETEKLLKEQNVLTKKADYGSLELYQVKHPKGQIYAINPVNVGPPVKVLDEDKAYQIYGEYITEDEKNSSDFPFRNLINNESEVNPSLYKLTSDGIEFLTGDQSLESSSASFANSVSSDVFVKSAGNKLTVTLSPKKLSGNSYSGSLDIPFEDIESPILNVNGTNSFIIPRDLSTGNNVSLGRVNLDTKNDNFLALYNKQSEELTTLPLTYDKISLGPCNGVNNTNDFGINFSSDKSFSIFSKGVPLCLTVPLSKVLNSNAALPDVLLFGINYDIKISNPNAPTYSCIENLENGNCLSYSTTNLSKSGFSQNSFNYGIKKSDLPKIGLRFYLDATKNNKPTTVSFNNLTISVTKPDQSAMVPGGEIRNLLPLNQPLVNPIVYFSGDKRLSQDLAKLPKTTGGCDTNPLVKNPDKNEFIDKKSGYTRYSTTDGSLCDSFSYQNLPQGQGYIAFITARNIKGLPLNVCVTNFYSKRCDVYTRLAYSKDFKTQAFVLPPMGDVATGYDVNVNNLAIKGTPSVNDLKSIVFVPFPYEMAMNLTTGRNAGRNDAQDIDYKEINPDLYRAGVPAEGKVLTLNYSYEKGWIAYSFNNDTLINRIFPFLFGKEIKQKVLVDNWANGWISDGKGGAILIVYLPQYLEYLGLIITGLSLTIISILALKSRKKKAYVVDETPNF